LAAAQAELQACENHLATKERELALKRCATVRDGLGLRIRALMECGWVWAEVGKQALQVLEELKVHSEMEQQHPSLPVSVSSPSRRPPLSAIGERRISSLLDINEDHAALHEHEDENDHDHDQEHETEHDHDHEPSSDLSSISPSQSASQRGDGEPLPPPISIGTLLRQLDPNAIGEASGSVEASTSYQAQPQDTVPTEDGHDHEQQRDSVQVQHQSMRSSGFSMATTTSSMYYSPAQPATYKVETMTYAPAVALHVPGTTSSSGKGKGKEKEVEGLPLPSSEVPPPAGSELFKESVQLHTTMRIPAPHAMNDEYAYRIPTAHPSPPPAAAHSDPSTSEAHSSPSGSASGHLDRAKRRSYTSPLASPTRASQSQSQPSTSYTRSNLSHPQLFSITAPRRVLERRITEEDIRKLSHSSDRSNEGEEGSSLEEEETRDETKLVKEGKLEVVENPRFMSEERKREVEREKRRSEEAEKKRKEKEEREAREREAKEREAKEKEGTKEKKRFGFFHSSSPSRSQTHPQPQPRSQPSQQAAAEEEHEHEQHVRFTDEFAGDSPSKLKHPSPSKGRFLGGLKTFFGGKQGSGQTPSPSPLASPVTSGHGHSRSLSLPRANSDLGAGAASSSEDEEEDSDSDTGRKGGKSSGGFALFGGRKKSKKKDKHKEKGFWGKDTDRDQGASGRWTTRTDKNISEIVQRRGSYDAAIPSLSRSASGSGSIGRSLGRGIASDAVLNAGKPPSGSVRNRTVSDVGVSTPASSVGVAGGRRLRKPRSGAASGGGGSPTEPSSAGGVSAHAQESSGSTTTSAGGGTNPPKVPSSILKSRSSIPAPLAARRSASVDDSASLSRRKSWVGENEEEDGEGEEDEGEEDDGMIVDLGWRRRTASEVTASPTPTLNRGTGAQVVKPVKSALVKPKSSTSALGEQTTGKSKDYSSDTAAMASASTGPSQGSVKRKKSLTKKRGQGPATTTTAASAAAGGAGPASGSAGVSTPTTGPKGLTIPPMPATMPPVPTAPPPPSSSLGASGLLNPVPTAPSSASAAPSSTTSTPTKKPGLKPPSSVSSSPYGTQGSNRGSQSMSTLATVLPANKNIDRPSGVSPQSLALNGGAGGGGGLSRNSSITSAASAPPRVGGAGKGGRHLKQSSLGQGVTSAINGGGPGSGLVRRSSLGMVPTTSSSVSAGFSPSKISFKAGPSSATSNANQQSLMSIVDGVSRANKEGSSPSTSKTKTLKSVGGTQKPAGLVELGSVKAPERVRREALEGHDVGPKGMASTSSLATVTPANVKDAKSKLGSGSGSGSGFFEIKAPGSVFEARDLHLPESQPRSQFQHQQQHSTSVTLAQPQPQKALAVPMPRRVPQPQPGQRHPPSPEEDLQIWATGTVPTANESSGSLTNRSGSSSKIPVMKASSPSPSHSHSPSPKPSSPSPLRSVLKNPTSRSPSPGVVTGGAGGWMNGVQQVGPVSTSPAPKDKEENRAPAPVDGTLPWGSDGSLRQPEGTTGVDKGKAKAKEQDVVPPSPVDEVDGTSDTETYETGNESFSEHEQDEEASHEEEHHEMSVPVAGPAVVVSQADSPSTSKLPNGVANGHAVGYDHGGSPKTGSVLSQAQSDTSTVRGASQTLQPLPVPTSAPAPAGSTTGSTSSTASGPRRRKSVRVSLQPTYSPSPPAIEYTPDEEQKEFSPWSSRDDSQMHQHAEREQQRATHHHPHHPLPKPTTIATQLLSSSRPAQPAPHSASAGHAASGEVERLRDMWADSSESEDEQYKRAKRLLSRAAKKEKDVHLLVANRTR
ncbi:hypothetical protein CVT26_001925, partial [Gymnopilus dilepis]